MWSIQENTLFKNFGKEIVFLNPLKQYSPVRVFSFWNKSLVKKEVAYRWKIRYDGR